MDSLTQPPARPSTRRLHRRVRRIRPIPFEQIEAPTSYANPAGRFALLGIACLAATLILLGIFGEIPITVRGIGELQSSSGPSTATRAGSMVAVVSFPMGRAERIQPGMKARVSPVSVSRRAYGEIPGEVASVERNLPLRDALPPLPEHSDALHGGTRPPSEAGPTPGVVLIRLGSDPDTASGYRWTFSKGPPEQIADRTACTAVVVVAKRRPWEVWRESIARWLGAGGPHDAGGGAK